MQAPNNRSIALGLTISLVVSVALISTLALAFTYFASLRTSRADLENRSNELVALLSEGLGPQIWNFDLAGMENVAKSYFQSEYVVGLRITDSFGKVLFEREKHHGSDLIVRTDEIEFQGKRLGTVLLMVTPRFYQEYATELLTQGAAILFAVLFALVTLTGIFLRVFLRRPLKNLGEVVNAYARGDYDYTPQATPPREFQPLVAVLSGMGERITSQLKEVTEAEAKYRTIFENTVEGLFQITPDGMLNNVNPAAAKILGYSSTEEATQDSLHYSSLFGLHDEERKSIKETLYQGKTVTGFEARIHRKDGKITWVSLNLRPVFDESDRFLLAEASIENIGARKKTEQALFQAMETAEAANRLKSEFLSTVSHELRTPMTSVLGFSKLIDRDLKKIFNSSKPTNETENKQRSRVRENLGIIVAESQRLSRLINDVLDLAKLEANESVWHIACVSPRELIQQAIASTTALVEDTQITLKSHFEDDVPSLECDHERIIQVLINLISNAVKFTDKGEISCTVAPSSEGVLFSIKDPGVGIPQNQQTQIFGKFKQLGDTLEGKPAGTGLGLAICKEIVEHHEGHIWMESQVGEGSTFFFSLPLKQSKQPLLTP